MILFLRRVFAPLVTSVSPLPCFQFTLNPLPAHAVRHHGPVRLRCHPVPAATEGKTPIDLARRAEENASRVFQKPYPYQTDVTPAPAAAESAE